MSEPGTNKLKIRKAVLADLPSIQQVFLRSIDKLTKQDYSSAQSQAWSASVKNKERWNSIVLNSYCLLAINQNQQIMGFGAIKMPDYIDLLYVDPNFVRQGVAQYLFSALQMEALQAGAKTLFTHASITAKPFFEKQGFKVLGENIVQTQGEELLNYHMAKKTPPLY